MEGWFNLPGAHRPFINGWHIESGNEQNVKTFMLFPSHVKIRKVFRYFDLRTLKLNKKERDLMISKHWMT